MSSTPGHGSDLRLIESLLWDGDLRRLERHLRRLAASAAHFDYPFDEAAVRERLSEAVSELPDGRPHKVRLTLGPEGGMEVERTEVEPTPEPVRVLLVDVAMDPSDDLLYHKTSLRRTYEEARRRASGAGFWEVLFRNDRGEVTEGSFTNVFVQEGSSWYTPPVACGLLPGVYRQALLENREGAEERVLRPEDVLAAGAVWVCNSVRGLKRARVIPAGPG